MPRDKDGDFEVGYGKPPRHTQFKRGQSGNPKGRPAGKTTLSTLLSDALDQPVIVVENGRRKKVSKREAIVTQLVNKSAAADLKATQIVLTMQRDIEARADPNSSDTITEADQPIIEQIKARFRGEKK